MSRIRHRLGFTLMEMTIAMTITAMIGLSVAGVSMVLGDATEYGENFYQSVQTARNVVMKIQKTIRSAKLVTASSSTAMVLWADDTNGDGQINLSETVLLSCDTTSGQIRLNRVVFPATMSAQTRAALDVTKTLADLASVNTVTSLITGNAYNTTTVLATDVAAGQFGVWPTAPLSHLVRFQLTVGTGDSAVTLRSAAATRAGLTSRVQMAGNVYVLTAPN